MGWDELHCNGWYGGGVGQDQQKLQDGLVPLWTDSNAIIEHAFTNSDDG